MTKNVKKEVVAAVVVAGAAVVAAKKCCSNSNISDDVESNSYVREKRGRSTFTVVPLSELLNNSRWKREKIF